MIARIGYSPVLSGRGSAPVKSVSCCPTAGCQRPTSADHLRLAPTAGQGVFATRLLPDDTAERLKSLAHSRGLSMNKLMQEWSAQALSAWDTENHFRALAATGDVTQALAILDRLDAEDGKATR